jgi:hypothetical protein
MIFQPVAGRISFPGEEISGEGIFKQEPGYGVKAMGSPRVAAGNPFYSQPASGKGTVEAQGIRCIKRA